MSGVRGWFRKFILRRKHGVLNLAPLKPEPWHKVLARARRALGEH